LQEIFLFRNTLNLGFLSFRNVHFPEALALNVLVRINNPVFTKPVFFRRFDNISFYIKTFQKKELAGFDSYLTP